MNNGLKYALIFLGGALFGGLAATLTSSPWLLTF